MLSKKLMSVPYALVASTLSFLLIPSVTLAAGMKMDVSAFGKKIGVLDVSTYDNLSNNNAASLKIIANFTKDGIEPGAEDMLKEWFPNGLTFMQTVMFMTDKQQRFFRRGKDEGDLIGKFSDPPQGGLKHPDNPDDPNDDSIAGADDKTPWYGLINPSMMAGDIPPRNPDLENNQFWDIPNIPFADANGIEGLAKVLNGKDGMLSFETALVGVKMKPEDDPMTPDNDERLTGKYKVAVLKTFTWGLNFKFVGNAANGLTGNDYRVTLKKLKFSKKPSKGFKGAFDQKGDNSDIEWNVEFVQHTPPPPPPNPCLIPENRASFSTTTANDQSSLCKGVPEPSSIVSLLAFGTLGTGTAINRNKQQKAVKK